jgi:peptide deformylase
MTGAIVQEGDPVLRQKAKPVAQKDIGSRKLNALIKKMKDALAGEKYGVAIAAPQVGKPLRVFVVAGRAFKEEVEEAAEGAEEVVPMDRVFINPKIVRLSKKKQEMREGCLSVRGKYGAVLRHEKASVEAQDEAGKPFTYHGSGLVGHIFQHECDHLEGILYTDKATQIEEDNWEQVAAEQNA